MFSLLLALTHGLANGPALPLDKMTMGDAASLHGQFVRVTCPASAPADTFSGWMMTGVQVVRATDNPLSPDLPSSRS